MRNRPPESGRGWFLPPSFIYLWVEKFKIYVIIIDEVGMFKFNEQCNPRQISLTGVRAIVILALLNIKPCSFEEIKDFLVSSNIVSREYSVDTIRIDLNTLKYIGCNISKATKSTNNMYILRSHPFQLNLTEEEIDTLKKIYKTIYKNLSVDRLLEYDELFAKLAETVCDTKVKEQLNGISFLKHYDKKLIKDLLMDCEKQTQLKILYDAPNTKPTEYNITNEKLGFRSDKLYVYCYNHSLKKHTFLNFSRIKDVLARKLRNDDFKTDDTIIEFEVNNYKNYELEEYEKIVDTKENYIKVTGSYYTDFIAMQRMLYFASDCTIISPDDMKENLIENLKKMRSQYE